MIGLRIVLDGDGAWPDLAEKQRRGELLVASQLAVSALAGGTASGAPSVAIRVDLDDGRVVFVETTLKLFLTAADALRARHGDPR